MDEQKTLTLDFIKSLMEPAYTLVWTDYDDNLDNHRGLIQKCLDSKSREHLWEEADVWYSDAEWEAVRGIIAKLKEECTVFNDFDEEDVDDFFDEHEDEIRDEIYSRNDSDVIKELIMHTDDIPIRVEMLSNYDCINSHWFESQGGYRYEESYFGDMVDSLNLNPARVKKILTKHGYKAYGRFPNRKNRNGREQVSYEQFYEELINSCCGANLLTYIGRVRRQFPKLLHIRGVRDGFLPVPYFRTHVLRCVPDLMLCGFHVRRYPVLQYLLSLVPIGLPIV